MEIHRSAGRHGVRDEDIVHATEQAVVVLEFEAEADPPKLLVIGPTRAGNLLEVIVLLLAEDRVLAIHAMPLREKYHRFLPGGGN